MAYQWDVVVSDAPEIYRYNEALGHQEQEQAEEEHLYLTEAFLSPAHSILGVPSYYATEQSEGRVLYIGGAHKGWQTETLRSIFKLWGKVEILPVVISVSSEEAFRWVVMENEERALEAIEKLHGRKLEEGHLIVSKSLPPGRTLTLVKKELISTDLDYYEDNDKTPRQTLYHGHPPPTLDTSDQKTPTKLHSIKFKIQDTDSLDSFEEQDFRSPEIPQPSQCSPLASPTKSEKAHYETQASSWANIAGKFTPDNGMVELKPERKPRLKPIGRIPKVVKTSILDAHRLVFLFNIPNTITATDVTKAVKEGSLVKIGFGYDNDSKKRYCGVVFQFARDAAAFVEVLDREARDSKPDRFRFIVEHGRSEQPGIEDILESMGAPTFATRRLTIVKAGFFFMFGERQLRDICGKLVGEDLIQLIWLYNGGNATVVFTDVSAAMKVKQAFDRRASRAASREPGASPIWAGVITTFSKDPCVFPLDLKTAMQY